MTPADLDALCVKLQSFARDAWTYALAADTCGEAADAIEELRAALELAATRKALAATTDSNTDPAVIAEETRRSERNVQGFIARTEEALSGNTADPIITMRKWTTMERVIAAARETGFHVGRLRKLLARVSVKVTPPAAGWPADPPPAAEGEDLLKIPGFLARQKDQVA